jgi:hypothetical protein
MTVRLHNQWHLLILHREQQRHNQVDTMRAIRSLAPPDHNQLVRVKDAVAGIHPDISNILAIIRPVADEVPSISKTINSLAFSMRSLVRMFIYLET